MKGMLEVMQPGMLTTIQDLGRPGYRKYGVPVSGAMDEHAFHLANWLVGNSADAPVFELTLNGGIFKFHSKATVGISGADAEIRLNDQTVQLNKTIEIASGDVLEIGKARTGCRFYLAISGDWEIENILGSHSTCLAAMFGGFAGRKLKKGDRISWVQKSQDAEIRSVPKKLTPHFSTRQTIRVIEGPEWNLLTKPQKVEFLSSDFQISSYSNRMGIRLEGKLGPEIKDLKEMVSSPVIPGIIQLPNSGLPIILMKDAQSVGGYPRIAKVVEADLWRLGQLWVWNEINFSLISFKESKALCNYYRNLIANLNSY